ncbi:hypothetical protein MASR1M32_34140 [Rhodobacter sp.]
MDDAVDWINGDPTLLRRIRASQPEVVSPVLPDDVAISALPADGPCPGGLLFTPTDATGIPTVYFHGGGFVVGSPETHRIVTAWIARLTRAPVISVRYRLAPEHPLPAQAQDAVAAIRRQLARHPRLRLMGDSAGGLVALWGHAGLTGADQARIEEAVLLYPGGLPVPPPPRHWTRRRVLARSRWPPISAGWTRRGCRPAIRPSTRWPPALRCRGG